MRSHWRLLSLVGLVWSLGSSTAEGEAEERIDVGSRPVVVTIALDGDPSQSREGVLVAVPVLTDGSEGEPLRQPIAVPGTTVLALPEQTNWRMSLEAKGLWAAMSLAKVGPVGTKVDLEAHLAGWVGARLAGPRPQDLPGELRLEIQGLDTGSSHRATDKCPVVDGRLHCALPSGRYDVRLLAEGWVPWYRWGLEVEAGETNDLGALRLHRGASIAGWILAPDHTVDLAVGEVELVPWVAGVPDAGTQAGRGDLIRRRTLVNDRGFFQFAGIEPGRYGVIARHPEFAESRSGDLVVETATEVEIDAIELKPAAWLELAIRHPTDPFNQPWVVVLRRRSREAGSAREPIEGRTGEDGVLVLRGLDPGDYLADVFDSRGGRWLAEGVTLHSGDNPVALEIGFRRLEGRLLWDGEPLAGAAVTLAQERGNARVHATSQEDGRFYVFLRRGAVWNVEVQHEAESIATVFPEVEVPPRREDEPWARRDFVIPKTEITSRVVDGLGNVLPEPVVVDARQELGRAYIARPARGGSFRIRGLAPGKATLAARFDGSVTQRRGTSARIEIEVVEDREIGPIDLVLKDSRQVEGQVVTASGSGLPGVEILPIPESTTGQPLGFWIPHFHTDFDGVFELDLPTATEGLRLTLFPPGFAMTQIRIDARSDQPVIVPVDSVAGTVVIRYEDPEPDWQDQLRLHTALFHHHGIPSVFLMRWVSGHGLVGQSPRDAWVIPSLEPGPYRACFGGAITAHLGVGSTPPAPLMDQWCSEPGYLASGGELVLTIPHRVLAAEFDAAAGP